MRRTFVGLTAVVLLGAASGPWQGKDFNDWTEKDAHVILSKSPWAKQIPMPAGGRPGVVVLDHGNENAPPSAASIGNPSNTSSGTNMTPSGNPGSAGPADPSGTHNLPNSRSPAGTAGSAGAPDPSMGLTVIWASAKPVRLAVLKLRSVGNTLTQAEIDRANNEPREYVVAVSGLPAPDPASDPATLKDNAFLTAKGKAPETAARSVYRKIGNSDVYFFHFPKANYPIAASDGQVEFKMKMGPIEVKRKFDLNEMQFQGQLAL